MLGGPGSVQHPISQNQPPQPRPMLTVNRGLVLLGALMSLTLCVALLLTSVMLTRQHFEASAPPTPFPHQQVYCGQSCLIGVAPDGRVVQVAVHIGPVNPQHKTRLNQVNVLDASTDVTLVTTRDLLPDETLLSARGRTLTYSELAQLLGVPMDVFYLPGDSKLVTVYSEQIYTATYVQEVCEMLPSDIYSAPTDIVFLSEREQMDAMRGANENIALDRAAYINWDGTININIFCNILSS